jgi:polysaccharide biosynthesis transport protein
MSMAFENTQPPPSAGTPDAGQTGFTTAVRHRTLSEALITLGNRRWVLVIAVLLGLGYGIFRAVSQPRPHEAYGRIQVLARAADAANVARIAAHPRYRVANGMDPNTIEGSIDLMLEAAARELNRLRSQVAAVQRASYAQLEATLGPNHPAAKGPKAQIDRFQKEIDPEQTGPLLQAQPNYVIGRVNEDQAAAALETQKPDAYKLRADRVDYTLRQHKFEASRTLYESLLQKLRTAGVQAGLETLEIDVVDQALIPADPKQPRQATVVITSVLFSLLGGIVVAWLMESLDTGLRSIAEIEGITGLPSLAIIPRARRLTAEGVVNLPTAPRNISVLTQPKSQFSEAFQPLRTSLLLSTAGHPPKFILLTSATPSEGKTTTATNLACILAQGDSRVLLVDADLRRPSVHHRFGLNGRIGLTTLLTGATRLEGSVQNIPEVPNLDVLPSGPIPPFPTEMLSSEAMDQVLARCGELYAYVIIDSPPILSATDGVILARGADAVVLVVRHGMSSGHVVRRARDLLLRAGAQITGVVLNAVDMNSPQYCGYHGYSGYSCSSVDTESCEGQKASSAAAQGTGKTAYENATDDFHGS